jgi:hypothetical protein
MVLKILNFIVEILLVLTQNLCFTDEAMNYSSFHMMRMVVLEM